MINVKNDINPCHKSVQKPATSVAIFSFIGAHELKKITKVKNKVSFKK